MKTSIDVTCRPADEGWACRVRLTGGAGSADYDVTVGRTDLDRLDPGRSTPEDLVRRSFEFLLERESPQSILRSFDLPVIGRYFPEFEARMIGRDV